MADLVNYSTKGMIHVVANN